MQEASRLTFDHADAPFHSLGVRSRVGAAEHVDGVTQRRERIAQFMAKRCENFVFATIGFGELLFLLAQRLFRETTFGDIALDFRETDEHPARVPDRRYGNQYVNLAAVFAASGRLEREHAIAPA